MKKTVCILMATVMFALCFALCSCSKAEAPKETAGKETVKETEPATVVGTWTTVVAGEEFLFPGDRWDTDSREWSGDIKLSLAFYDSGTVVLGLAKGDVRDFIANNLEAVNAMFDYTIEEVMEEGKFESEDDLIDALIDTFASLNKTGKYTYEDGVVSTELVSVTHTHGKDEEEETASEIAVEVTANTLTFTGYVTDGGDNNLFDADALPLSFSRYN